MYKDNKMVMKSMTIMNKLYSTKRNMFNIGSKAQVFMEASLRWFNILD